MGIKLKNLISKRFQELEDQIQTVLQTKRISSPDSPFGSQEYYDSDTILGWAVKVKNLLVKVAGENSEHYKSFLQSEKSSSFSNVSKFNEYKAIFLAAKEDYEGGYLSSYKSIVQAEVFDSELEQAIELLNNGYYVAAAVIAGTVMETAIRELCLKNEVTPGKLERMNADLAKENIYNINVQKQVTALAATRNSAAHGKTTEFNHSDVKQMIDTIQLLLTTHLSVNV
ncbi:MAG: DUF4145 domain-containing protein [Cellvibrio sp. 79]|nr:MAG: DUF4145 domain-containing protein [Cellvibrio sp. 79]